jgi:hypothetical protein
MSSLEKMLKSFLNRRPFPEAVFLTFLFTSKRFESYNIYQNSAECQGWHWRVDRVRCEKYDGAVLIGEFFGAAAGINARNCVLFKMRKPG